MINTLIFVAIASGLIFFHELGHFMVAKFFGIKVETFSIGFGKKLYTKHWKGTDWSISIIPLGGYIMMKNDLSNLERSKENRDNYAILHPLKKIVVSFAGSFANILLAFLLYVAIGLMDHQETSNEIGDVYPNSPASKVGIHIGDRIVSINDKEIVVWRDLFELSKNTNEKIPYDVVIESNGTSKHLTITPYLLEKTDRFGEPYKRYALGIEPKGETLISFGFLKSLEYGYDKTISWTEILLFDIKEIIVGSASSNNIGGVIMLKDSLAKAKESGIVTFIWMCGLISISIAIFNLLPIPMLDGGQILLHLYQLITNKTISEKTSEILSIIGFMIIIGIFLFGLYNDINR